MRVEQIFTDFQLSSHRSMLCISGVLTFSIGSYTFAIHDYMFWACLLYSIIGIYLAHVVGNKLIQLKYNQQKYEANFCFNMMRVRENSESIAFYGGEQMELAGFDASFASASKTICN